MLLGKLYGAGSCAEVEISTLVLLYLHYYIDYYIIDNRTTGVGRHSVKGEEI